MVLQPIGIKLDQSILFTPSSEAQRRSALWQFLQDTAIHHGGKVGDYSTLHAWSVRDPENFYACLWDALGVIGERGQNVCTIDPDLRRSVFFPDARVNYAENLLHAADATPAVISYTEHGARRQISRAELRDEVARAAQALREEGVGKGDRVAAIISNDQEAIIACLATASIGAIWSSCSPDFGAAGAGDRLGQIDPCILIAVTSYRYAGRTFDITPTIKSLAEISNLKRIVVIGAAIDTAPTARNWVRWEDWLRPYPPRPISYERLPGTAPLVILFSSGTTGRPKCIVHSATGLLLQHKKELLLHCDLKAGEKLFYYTTCGWMMWNWMLSGLAARATLVTYAGDPFHPGPRRLPDLIDAEDIEVFGVSASYLSACARAGLRPAETHRLARLRLMLSTGSPLLPAGFDYVYRHWKTDVDLASISGGTDICGCFLGGNPLLPVRRGELKCAMLGMDVDAVDAAGTSVTGVPGELVCRNAHLSMPLQFWGDADGGQYHAAYFARIPNVWTHGDYAERTASGGWIIHGRSDTTLKPGGVRIGTAEIYRQLETIATIDEAVAVGLDKHGDQTVILFVRLKPGMILDGALEQLIRNRIRQGASPRHVPGRIVAIDAIPRTRSGKISESAVRDVIHGREVKNASALANPESLELYRDLPQLRD
jgi:acetoacetyl-CoA synthetase